MNSTTGPESGSSAEQLASTEDDAVRSAEVHDVGPEPPAEKRNRAPRWSTVMLGALTMLGVLLITALAPAAHFAAAGLPLPSGDLTPLVEGSTKADATAMRALPVGLPTGQRIASVQDVYPYAEAALGIPGARALMGVLSSPGEMTPNQSSDPNSHDYGYPYHYSVLEPILANAPEGPLRSNAMALAAALIKLSGQAGTGNLVAAPVAYAVLDRIRTSGGCDAQLDLLLLVAGDANTSAELLLDEYRRSSAACPNDPTPGWVTGQAQMRKLKGDMESRPARVDGLDRTAVAMALTTFQNLVSRFPRDTSVVTGLGDAYARAGLLLLHSDPFTARDDLRLAVEQYNRAAELGDRHSADLGRARVFIGLGEPERAVALATRAVGDSPDHPGAALEVLLAAEQAAHHFDAAQEVAHRMERSGANAYPDATAFYPAPTAFDRGLPFDAALPLSMGADTLAPLQDDLTPSRGRGGGIVEDLAFIPDYRDNDPMTATLADCPSLAWRRDAIIDGRAEAALADWPRAFESARPYMMVQGCGWQSTDVLRQIAELAVRPLTVNASLSADQLKLIDEWQNMLRWAGDLSGARKLLVRWEELDTENPMPALRFGEVAFLGHDFNEAAAQFGEAARRARLRQWNDELTFARAQLGRGAALVKAHRGAEAVALLRPLEDLGTQGYAFQRTNGSSAASFDAALQFATLSYYAAVQLGDYESATADLRAAIDDYRFAASWTDRLRERNFRAETVYNNLALAYLGVGATDLAAANADRAIQADPMSPVFLMTAGFVAERAGNRRQAIDYNRRALRSDPGAFPAANDLGVELARQHDYAAAETALRRAVGASPDYALGWFNLGVLESHRGPMHLPASQGAFGKAFRLDGTLNDRRRELTIDGNVYRTALDLSKPIPPRWSLAQTQKAAPITTAGLLTGIALIVGLARASSNRGGGDFAKRWLDPISKRVARFRGPAWLQRPVWALGATIVSFSLAYLRHVGSLNEMVAYALGIMLLAGVAMYARVAVAARAKVSAVQSSWLPGMMFGLATGAAGITWAPLPVATADPKSERLHLAAPLAVAVLAITLFVEAAWLAVPLSQLFAVAALIMAGSMLIPVKPLDGANVGKAGAVAAAGVVGGAILVTLGIA